MTKPQSPIKSQAPSPRNGFAFSSAPSCVIRVSCAKAEPSHSGCRGQALNSNERFLRFMVWDLLIFFTMSIDQFKREKTFVLVKPDGVRKGLIGEIIRRFEQRDLKIVALEMFQPTKKQINDHYPKDAAWITRLGEKSLSTYQKYGIDPKKELGTDKAEKIGPMVRTWLVDYMTSAPLVRMVPISAKEGIVGPAIPSDRKST